MIPYQLAPVMEYLSFWVIAAACNFETMLSVIDSLHGHLIFCQRSCLVGTDDRRASKGFDSGKLSHDCVPARHAGDTYGHGHGHHDGEPSGIVATDAATAVITSE